MELRHLRYFIAVAEEENVSRAALKLHVSQPGLSRQVRDLEDELGFSLLERSGKSVHLTAAGRVFLTEAKSVMQRAQDAVQAARAVATGKRGEIQVGYAPSLTVQILPPILRAFQSELPGVRVTLRDLSTEEMLDQLTAGKLQVALLVRPPAAMLRGLNFTELARYACRVALAPKHPLARQRVITLAQVAREPLIAYSRKDYPEYHQMLAVIFAGIKDKLRIAEEHDNVTSLITAVEIGSGIAVVPESLACFAGPRLKLMPLSPEPAPLIVGAVWAKSALADSTERFLKCAKASALNK